MGHLEVHTKLLSEDEEVKTALGIGRRRWNDNIKRDVTEILCEVMD